MRRIIVHIATSADRYIARPDGSLDWLTSRPAPKGFYGMPEFTRQQHTCRGLVRQFLGDAQTLTYEAFITPVFGLSQRFVAPVGNHRRQRSEGMRCHWRAPQAAKEFRNDDILLRLRYTRLR